MDFWKLLQPQLRPLALVNPPRPKTMRPTDSSVVDTSGQVLGKCMRQVYYRMTGDETEPDSESLEWMAFMGKAVEDALEPLMMSAGLKLQRNLRFHLEKERVAGEIDFVVKDPQTEEIVGIELKTFFGYPSKKKLFGGKDRSGKYTAPSPKEHHLLQAVVYLWGFRDQVSHWKICYFGRDTTDRTEFDLHLTQDGDKTRVVVNGETRWDFSVEDILERYRKLAHALDTKTIPPREFVLSYTMEEAERLYSIGRVTKTDIEAMRRGKKTAGDVQCRQCAHKKTCWGAGILDDEESLEDEDFS